VADEIHLRVAGQHPGEGNVFPSVAQRRDANGKDIPSVEQIAPEFAVGDHFLQVAVGCREVLSSFLCKRRFRL
jgi:hypothetical protein